VQRIGDNGHAWHGKPVRPIVVEVNETWWLPVRIVTGVDVDDANLLTPSPFFQNTSYRPELDISVYPLFCVQTASK
jgi:hypothetical protein